MIEPRDLRFVLRWDQQDLAVAMGWSQSKAARWEAGENVRLSDEDRVRLARLRVLADRRSAEVDA